MLIVDSTSRSDAVTTIETIVIVIEDVDVDVDVDFDGLHIPFEASPSPRMLNRSDLDDDEG